MDRADHAAGELFENTCFDCDKLADSDRSKIRLPCTGELINVASIGLVVVRSTDADAEVTAQTNGRVEEP